MIEIQHRSNGPISQKVISGIRKTKGRKVVDLSLFKEAKLTAENLDKTIISEKEMADLDPVHAVCAYAQNELSVFVEQLSELQELTKLVNSIADAQPDIPLSKPQSKESQALL